jgi:hypothetical protein
LFDDVKDLAEVRHDEKRTGTSAASALAPTRPDGPSTEGAPSP